MYRFEKFSPKVNYILDAFKYKKYRRVMHVFRSDVFPLANTLRACEPEKFSVMIDGGANHGQTSRAMLIINSNMKILAFEPLAQIQEEVSHPRYRNTVAQDLNILASQYPHFKFFPVALSDRIGEMNFYSTKVDECSSLLAPPSGPSESQFSIIHQSTVPTTTLDSIIEEQQIEKVDLLKLDLQGGELLALQGAVNTLQHTCYVLVEINIRRAYIDAPVANDVTEFLDNNGFIFSDIVRNWRTEDHSIYQIDGLFRNRQLG